MEKQEKQDENLAIKVQNQKKKKKINMSALTLNKYHSKNQDIE